MAKEHKPTSSPSALNIWVLSGDIGLKIALPLILFMLLGIKLDKTFNTLPLFMIIGILLAFVTSALLVARMIKQVNNQGKSE